MIKDGKYLEDRSVALVKLEVDVATAADMAAQVSRLDARIDNIDARITVEVSRLDTRIDNLDARVTTEISNLDNRITQEITNISGDLSADYVRKTGNVAEVITGNKTFTGNTVFQGATTTVDSQNLAVSDNEIVLNKNETSDHVSLGRAGIRIERGTGVDYVIEVLDVGGVTTLKAGQDGSTKVVAFVSDIPSIITGLVPLGANPNDILRWHNSAWTATQAVTFLDADKLDGHHYAEMKAEWEAYVASFSGGETGANTSGGIVATGVANFSGSGNFVEIPIGVVMPDRNYIAWVVPSEDGDSRVGEFWVSEDAADKTTTSFKVFNDGSAQSQFRWAVANRAGGLPVGSITAYSGTTAPEGFLICDGSAISRTTYSALFEVIGTTYGVGDGASSFNIMDLRGLFIRGLDNGAGVDSDRAMGSYQGDDFTSHVHDVTVTGVYGTYVITPVLSGGAGGSPYTVQATCSEVGGDETRPKNRAFNYIVKY